MKSEVYDKLRSSVSMIDDLNTSADNAFKLLNDIKGGKSKAKFIVYGENGSSTTELSKDMSEKMCEILLERYHELIKKEKDNMNAVVDSAIGERL